MRRSGRTSSSAARSGARGGRSPIGVRHRLLSRRKRTGCVPIAPQGRSPQPEPIRAGPRRSGLSIAARPTQLTGRIRCLTPSGPTHHGAGVGPSPPCPVPASPSTRLRITPTRPTSAPVARSATAKRPSPNTSPWCSSRPTVAAASCRQLSEPRRDGRVGMRASTSTSASWHRRKMSRGGSTSTGLTRGFAGNLCAGCRGRRPASPGGRPAASQP